MERPDGIFLIPNLKGGGAEKVALNLALKFLEWDLKVMFIVFDKSTDYPDLVVAHLDVREMRAKRVLYALPELIIHLRRLKPKFIVSFLTSMNILLSIASVFKRRETRIVISERSLFSRKEKFTGIFVRRGIRFLYKRVDGIIAISSGVKQDLLNCLSIGSDSVHVINNPLLQSAVRGKDITRIEKQQVCLGSSEFSIVAIGRLEPVKNFKFLIKVFELIKNELDCSLVILGEGPERAGLEGMIESKGLTDCVFLPGFVQNPEDYLLNSDVFVSTSLWEGFGNVILEAMAAGLPIVINNCEGGSTEILGNGRWGSIAEFNDEKDFADKVIFSVEQGKRDYSERLKDFELDKIARCYLAYIFTLDT